MPHLRSTTTCCSKHFLPPQRNPNTDSHQNLHYKKFLLDAEVLQELEKNPEFAPPGTESLAWFRVLLRAAFIWGTFSAPRAQNMELVIGWNGTQQQKDESQAATGAEELALRARVFWFDDRSARGAQLPADGGSYQRGRDDAKGWVVGLDLARSSLAGTGCNHLPCSVSPCCCFDNQFSRHHMQSCYTS